MTASVPTLLRALAIASPLLMLAPAHAASPPRGDASTAKHDADRAHASDGDSRRKGVASFYSKGFAGKKTASGERYDPQGMTAAHRTLPLGTKVKVTNPDNDKSVVVTVNDRGPLPKSRTMDLSNAAASELGMTKSGVKTIETQVVGKTDVGPAGAKTAKDAKP